MTPLTITSTRAAYSSSSPQGNPASAYGLKYYYPMGKVLKTRKDHDTRGIDKSKFSAKRCRLMQESITAHIVGSQTIALTVFAVQFPNFKVIAKVFMLIRIRHHDKLSR
jgi:hypothetical protein